MPYRMHETQRQDAGHAEADATPVPYGVAVRDIFSDARWVQAEPVRVRDWHDSGRGTPVQAFETDFD